MRLASPRLAIAILVLLTVARIASGAPIQVYIVAGQSNANGGGNILELDSNNVDLAQPQSNLYQYRISGAETADWQSLGPRPANPLAPPRLFGAELSFGQAMERRTGSPVAIIKVAYNGTSLGGKWLPSLDDLYPLMVDKVESSLSQLEAANYQPTLAGFLWIQGEGDAAFLTRAEAYDENLLTLAAAVRADFSVSDLPFLFNELHADVNRAYRDELRVSQRLAAGSPGMLLVNADDQTLRSDHVHFTTGMHVELGRRFADALLPSADFNDDGVVDGADLAAWRGSVGVTRVGDGNADRVADGADFLMWQRQLSPAPSAVTVPEPTSILLAMVCFGGLKRRSRFKTMR